MSHRYPKRIITRPRRVKVLVIRPPPKAPKKPSEEPKAEPYEYDHQKNPFYLTYDYEADLERYSKHHDPGVLSRSGIFSGKKEKPWWSNLPELCFPPPMTNKRNVKGYHSDFYTCVYSNPSTPVSYIFSNSKAAYTAQYKHIMRLEEEYQLYLQYSVTSEPYNLKLLRKDLKPVYNPPPVVNVNKYFGSPRSEYIPLPDEVPRPPWSWINRTTSTLHEQKLLLLIYRCKLLSFKLCCGGLNYNFLLWWLRVDVSLEEADDDSDELI